MGYPYIFRQGLIFTKCVSQNFAILLNKYSHVPGNYLVFFRYGRFDIVYLFRQFHEFFLFPFFFFFVKTTFTFISFIEGN